MGLEKDHKKVWGHGYHAGLNKANNGIRGHQQTYLNCTNSMVCWNPGTDQIKIVPCPDYGMLSQGFTCTGLGAYSEVQKMGYEQRKTMTFITAMHLIVRDKCDPVAVHNAFLSLDEYRDGCADDMLRGF